MPSSLHDARQHFLAHSSRDVTRAGHEHDCFGSVKIAFDERTGTGLAREACNARRSAARGAPAGKCKGRGTNGLDRAWERD